MEHRLLRRPPRNAEHQGIIQLPLGRRSKALEPRSPPPSGVAEWTTLNVAVARTAKRKQDPRLTFWRCEERSAVTASIRQRNNSCAVERCLVASVVSPTRTSWPGVQTLAWEQGLGKPRRLRPRSRELNGGFCSPWNSQRPKRDRIPLWTYRSSPLSGRRNSCGHVVWRKNKLASGRLSC